MIPNIAHCIKLIWKKLTLTSVGCRFRNLHSPNVVDTFFQLSEKKSIKNRTKFSTRKYITQRIKIKGERDAAELTQK